MRYLSCFLLLFFSIDLFAEGTVQLMPITGNGYGGYLHLSKKPAFTNFGQYGASEERQIKIRIGEVGETIYWGLNNQLQGGNFVADLPYRIKSPSGQIVFESVIKETGKGSLSTYNQAMEGPRQLLSDQTKGYDAESIVATETGDYIIEFDMSGVGANDEVQIQLFDITVAGTDKKPIQGRLHSKSWQMSTGSATNKLMSKVYPIDAKGVVYEVDFNEMQPYTFVINFNSFGTSNSGIKNTDRQSIYTKSLSQAQIPEFEVFLNPPDEKYYPTIFKEAEFKGEVVRKDCQKAEFCLTFSTTAEGFLEGFIDLNNNGIYDKDQGDIYFSEMINQPGQKCVEWDGRDANGNVVNSNDIKVYSSIGYNVTHLPLWDVEANSKGFKVQTVRPSTLPDPLIFWDDSKITTGTVPAGETKVNLDGCNASSGCHRWTKRGEDNNNSETINTWWYTVVEYEVLALSTAPQSSVQLSFDPSGLKTKDTVVCKSDVVDFYIYNDLESHYNAENFIYEWHVNNALLSKDQRNYKATINEQSLIVVKAISKQNALCFTSDTLKVSTVQPVSIKSLVTDGSCSLTPGAINVTITEGPPNPVFSWTELPTHASGMVTDLAAGTYHLKIADPEFSENCAKDTSFQIKGATPIEINELKVDSSECFAATGSAVVTMKDMGRNYEYKWNTKPYSDSSEESLLIAGEHTLEVFESSTGCSVDSVFVIPEKQLSVEHTTTPETCEDQTGSIKLVLPSADFDIVWNGQQVEGPTINQLHTGNYPILVSSSSNPDCKSEFVANVKNIEKRIEAKLILEPVNCGLPTGSAEVVMPDSKDYLFKWSTSLVAGKTQKITTLPVGEYELTVTENGTTCKLDTAFTITGTDSIEVSEVSVTPSECYHPSGSARVLMKDSNRDYIFAWNSFEYAPQNLKADLKAGDHIVRVKDVVSGCLDSAKFTISKLPLVVPFEKEDEVCKDSKGKISLELPVAEFDIYWNDEITKDPVKENLSEGTVDVKVVSVYDNSCTYQNVFTINNLGSPILITDISTEPSDCGIPTGKARVILAEDDRRFQYTWDSSAPLSSGEISGLEVGEHSVTVTEVGTNCSASAPFRISGKGFNFSGITRPDVCKSGNGSIDIIAIGNNINIQWKDNLATQLSRNNLPAGTYNFILSNGSDISCRIDTSISVRDSSYSVNADFDFISLAYQSRMEENAMIRFSNNTAGNIVSNEWIFGDGNKSFEKNTQNRFKLPGEYNVILNVKDNNGCIGSITKPLRINTKVPCELALPDAFSPNQDQYNDELNLLGHAETVDLKVFNRWGEVIFRTEQMDGKWEGDYRGEEVPIGVYPYRMEYECPDESGNLVKTELIGEITIVR